MSKFEWVMVAVTFGIIVIVVFVSNHYGGYRTTEANYKWKKFAIANDCKITESYFGLIEKWICDDNEIYWR